MINGSINCIIHFYGELKQKILSNLSKMVHLSELADLSLRLLWSKTNCFYPYADVRFQTNISTDEQITLSARFSFDCECSGCGRSGARNFLRLWRRHDTLENVNNPEGLACEILKTLRLTYYGHVIFIPN